MGDFMKEKELLISLSDDQWPYEYIDHDRTVARAIVYDEEENFYFIRAHRNDIFGDVQSYYLSNKKRLSLLVFLLRQLVNTSLFILCRSDEGNNLFLRVKE